MSLSKDFIILMAGRISYKANRFLLAELRKVNITNFASSHGEILGALMVKGKLQLKVLIKLIDKDKSTITALVKKLIRLGYIQKVQDVQDKRKSYISLTKKGELLRTDYMNISKKLREKAYKNITEKEKEILFRLLNKIDGNL